MSHPIGATAPHAVVTMSSRDIADLVGSRHDSVKRAIERLAERGVIELPPLVEISTATKPVTEYRICKRDSYVIVAQLSPEFTARLVDRWQELESQQAPRIPQTLSEALRLAADQAEQIERQRPAVEFVSRYVESDGLLGFRQVAKLLRANEKEFRQFLADKSIMYRLGRDWTPYQSHIDAGRFEIRAGTAENDHSYTSAKFTPKGVTWIAGLWGQRLVEIPQDEKHEVGCKAIADLRSMMNRGQK